MTNQTIQFEDSGKGEVILAMHSLGGSLRMWDAFANSAQQDWRILRFDSIGHGDDARSQTFSIEANARDAIAVLDLLGIEHVHLLGISMGGHTALRIFQLWPHRVASIVLANTSAGGAPDAQQRLQLVRDKISNIGFETFAIEYVKSRFSSSMDLVVIEEYLQSTLKLGSNAFQETLHSILQQDFAKTLPLVNAPCLVISGDEDLSTPPSTAAALADAIRGAKLTILKNAGHFSCLDQPLAFNQVVLEFFNSLNHEGLLRPSA